MGGCSSKDESDSAVAKVMAEAESRTRDYVRVLLLGTGASGKSTVFRQMIQLQGGGFSQEEMDMYRPVLVKNTVESAVRLYMEADGLYEQGFVECKLQDRETWDKLLVLAKEALAGNYRSDIGMLISMLWQGDPGMRGTFSLRDKFELLDSAEYFLDRAVDLFMDDYKVTMEDMLRMRLVTTGMKEETFSVKGTYKQLVLIDVGGQRSERRKWIRWFSSVDAVLFIAAINDFDQNTEELSESNRFQEAVAVWNEVTSLDTFKDMSFVLFLNKCDLLAEKLNRVNFTEHFPEFIGDPVDVDFKEEVLEFFRGIFEGAKGNDAPFFVHNTTATDTQLIAKVLKDVISSLLQGNITGKGLM